MKYIMFPLHLLRFCIFGTTTLSIDQERSKDRKEIEPSQERSKEKRDKRIEEKRNEVSDLREKEDDTEDKVEKRSNDDSDKFLKDKTKLCDANNRSNERRTSRDRKNSNDNDNKINEKSDRKQRSHSIESRKSLSSRRVDDDSDSSSCDKWSTAESSMDVSIEYESTYESISTSCCLEEPMDISIEESIEENSLIPTVVVSHRTRTVNVGPSSSSSWSSEVEESSSYSSIDEEISRVFQKKCTSSSSDDDYYSSSVNRRDKRRDESDRRDRKGRDDVNSREFILESREKLERGGSRSNVKRTEENHRDRTTERTTSGITSCKHNSSPRRVSRTPVKSKDTRKRYKEKGVQTDSAFSDDDVEMIPLDARLTEKRVSNRTSRRKPLSVSYQTEGIDRDILYIADNEDSNDGCGRYSRNRITPVSESSSSTDLGFEDQRCPNRNYKTHVTEKERRKSPLRDDTTINDLSKKVTLSRAPPGFPQIPQNPPMSLKGCIDRGSFHFPFSTDTNLTITQYGQNYPPAPAPMRHLYHEYPEFMPFPEEIGTLQFFKTIPSNGYLC